MQPSPYVGFWWHLLEDGGNVVMMKPLKSREHAAEELASMVHELEAHDAKAQQIAESGRQLAHDVLTSQAALQYWQKLLVEYAKLQRFTPQLHPDALPLHESISRPQQDVVMDFAARTCSVFPSDKKQWWMFR